jgi:hypothetical protein
MPARRCGKIWAWRGRRTNSPPPGGDRPLPTEKWGKNKASGRKNLLFLKKKKQKNFVRFGCGLSAVLVLGWDDFWLRRIFEFLSGF